MATQKITGLQSPTTLGKDISNAKVLGWDATDNTLEGIPVGDIESASAALAIETMQSDASVTSSAIADGAVTVAKLAKVNTSGGMSTSDTSTVPTASAVATDIAAEAAARKAADLAEETARENAVSAEATARATAIAAETSARKSAIASLKQQITDLVGTAPEAYDTLQEIAAWIEAHGTDYASLLALVETKAAQTDLDTLSESVGKNVVSVELDEATGVLSAVTGGDDAACTGGAVDTETGALTLDFEY